MNHPYKPSTLMAIYEVEFEPDAQYAPSPPHCNQSHKTYKLVSDPHPTAPNWIEFDLVDGVWHITRGLSAAVETALVNRATELRLK